MREDSKDDLPDVRDGLTRLERTLLDQLRKLQDEKGGRRVSALMLYGRVLEVHDVSRAKFQSALSRMVGMSRVDGDAIQRDE